MALNLATKIINSHVSKTPAGDGSEISLSVDRALFHERNTVRFARPGQVLVGAENQVTTSGAVGTLALGADGLEVAEVLTGQPFEMKRPVIVGVELLGQLSPWVEARDIVRELLRRRGSHGGSGRIFEFYGEGVATLGVGKRAMICKLMAELEATAAIFPSDEQTRQWLASQKREDQWVPLSADEDAGYDEIELIELDLLGRQAA